MAPGQRYFKSGAIYHLERKEERVRIKSVALSQIYNAFSCVLRDIISGLCQYGSPQQDVVSAQPSVVHRIGAFEARGGTECHVAPQVADVKRKKKKPGMETC